MERDRRALTGSAPDEAVRLIGASERPAAERALEDRVEARLTERARDVRGSASCARSLLEQSVGELAPDEALAVAREMIAERRVLPLEGGLMTTLAVRARSRRSSAALTAARPAGAAETSASSARDTLPAMR